MYVLIFSAKWNSQLLNSSSISVEGRRVMKLICACANIFCIMDKSIVKFKRYKRGRKESDEVDLVMCLYFLHNG